MFTRRRSSRLVAFPRCLVFLCVRPRDESQTLNPVIVESVLTHLVVFVGKQVYGRLRTRWRRQMNVETSRLSFGSWEGLIKALSHILV